MIDPRHVYDAAMALPPPTMAGGASGYFSEPSDTLDPELFDGDHLKPGVRDALLFTLGNHLSQQYVMSPSWAHVWLAGSGISYQWNADRGNGDLDVLFSLDVTLFASANPQLFHGWSEEDIAAEVNDELKARLWPQTAHYTSGGKVFEVTFYWNPGTDGDIRRIHPYAAYDLVTDAWVVRPPKQPPRPGWNVQEAFANFADQDAQQAGKLASLYSSALIQMHRSKRFSPEWHEAGRELAGVTRVARGMFDEIHKGRHEAFMDQGTGYADWHNYRWQAGKQSGAVGALRSLAAIHDEAKRREETSLFGSPIEPADRAARQAARWRSQR
jgi:hypothetical protein